MTCVSFFSLFWDISMGSPLILQCGQLLLNRPDPFIASLAHGNFICRTQEECLIVLLYCIFNNEDVTVIPLALRRRIYAVKCFVTYI